MNVPRKNGESELCVSERGSKLVNNNTPHFRNIIKKIQLIDRNTYGFHLISRNTYRFHMVFIRVVYEFTPLSAPLFCPLILEPGTPPNQPTN
jgi:hypothetical protein